MKEVITHSIDGSGFSDGKFRALMRACDSVNLGDVNGTTVAFAGSRADHRRFVQALERAGVAA